MITAQDIGVLAMMHKLRRILLPEGTPWENIDVRLDGSERRKRLAEWLATREKEVADLSAKMNYDYSFLLTDKDRKRYEYDGSNCLKFGAWVGENTYFAYTERVRFWQLYSTETFPTEEEEPGYKFYGYMGCLSYDHDDDWTGIFHADVKERNPHFRSEQARKAFTKKWMGYFRRNLWLCGCEIECTVEERRQWIEGVSPEDVRDWRLRT